MFERWRIAIERGCMKVNVDKTKLLLSGRPLQTRRGTGRYPCGVCGSGVRSNYIHCTQRNKWIQKRFSVLASFASVRDFRCSTYVQTPHPISSEVIEMDDATIEEVEKFCCLGDVLDIECSANAAVKARISAAWSKWRKINSLFCN